MIYVKINSIIINKSSLPEWLLIVELLSLNITFVSIYLRVIVVLIQIFLMIFPLPIQFFCLTKIKEDQTNSCLVTFLHQFRISLNLVHNNQFQCYSCIIEYVITNKNNERFLSSFLLLYNYIHPFEYSKQFRYYLYVK